MLTTVGATRGIRRQQPAVGPVGNMSQVKAARSHKVLILHRLLHHGHQVLEILPKASRAKVARKARKSTESVLEVSSSWQTLPIVLLQRMSVIPAIRKHMIVWSKMIQ